MNDAPLTDKSEQRVRQEYSLTGFCLAEDMQELELDRAELLRLLKMTVDCLERHSLYGQPYNLSEAKTAIDRMEKTQ